MESILEKGVTTIFPSKELLEKTLSENKTLRVYMGIDPTATHIHLGHAVALRKLQRFVELGHSVTFLIGDFTALIGDTSDKDTERPVLTSKEIHENFQTYKQQASKILDFDKVTVVHNSEWLSQLSFSEIVKLCQHFSVGDFVGRELIKKRLSEGKKVGLHETLYPVMQGYDSYHLDTDIQIGGGDQTFNMLAGRTLQKDLRNKESFVLCVDYLIGTDGRKMSKSWGNAIWLDDTAEEVYGKVMSLSDNLIENYFVLATQLPESDIQKQLQRLSSGENPMEVKKVLAHQITKELHDEVSADKAAHVFEETFQHAKPDYSQILTLENGATLIDAVAHISGSNSEAKRLISSSSVDINDENQIDGKKLVQTGDKLKIGKRTFVTIQLQ